MQRLELGLDPGVSHRNNRLTNEYDILSYLKYKVSQTVLTVNRHSAESAESRIFFPECRCEMKTSTLCQL